MAMPRRSHTDSCDVPAGMSVLRRTAHTMACSFQSVISPASPSGGTTTPSNLHVLSCFRVLPSKGGMSSFVW